MKTIRFRCAILSLVFLLIGCERREDFFEDQNSHAVKMQNSLTGQEEIVFKQKEYDPNHANWQRGVTLSTATPILDGDIVLINISNTIYAVRFKNQDITPEKLTYEYWKVEDSYNATQKAGKQIEIDGLKIDWSCLRQGQGTIYMDQFFIPGFLPRFQVGMPFIKSHGDNDRNVDLKSIHFETFPWKV